MRSKILFVVMSAVARPETIDQLARALAPHTVLVHHDFSQTPDFTLTADNVRLVPNPRRTGWATFGFVDGIFHSLEYAAMNLQFDYLQLLSPTCLPVRPLVEFEAQVQRGADAHFGAIDLLADRDCLMSVGYRAFTPMNSFWHRVLRRLSGDYFDGSPGRRDEAGVWLRSGGGYGLEALIARCAVHVFSRGWMGRHPFHPRFRPYYGSVWFGARPSVITQMVDGYQRTGVRAWFSQLRISEEFLVPTLLMQVVRRKGPLLHYISRFDEAHPQPLDEAQLGELRASGAYFARKFPDDPAAVIRLRVLQELAGVGVAGKASRPRAPEHADQIAQPGAGLARTGQPVSPIRAAVLGLQGGWQSFAGAGRRFRH